MKWWPMYSHLHILRSQINSAVPWFGTSVTLDLDMLVKVKMHVGFDETTHMQKTSINRPKILFTIKPLEHPCNKAC